MHANITFTFTVDINCLLLFKLSLQVLQPRSTLLFPICKSFSNVVFLPAPFHSFASFSFQRYFSICRMLCNTMGFLWKSQCTKPHGKLIPVSTLPLIQCDTSSFPHTLIGFYLHFVQSY